MPNLEDKIKLIKDIKKFAVKELGIVPNNSFKKVKKIDDFYVLYASRKDKLKSVIRNYCESLEYTTRKKCEKAEELFKSRGYDVLNQDFEAVGKEDCPITTSMLKCSKTRLAYLVLHENFHIHCRENPLGFKLTIEEAVADYFAYKGSLKYFASNPSMVGHIKKDLKEWQKFFDFINKYTKKLEEAYEESEAKGRRVLDNAKRAARRRKPGQDLPSKTSDINNAYFLRQRIYAAMARPVYEVLEGMEPKEYTTNTRKLKDTLGKIKPRALIEKYRN